MKWTKERVDAMREYVTPTQLAAMEARAVAKTRKDAAEALGISEKRLTNALDRAIRTAARRGYSPKEDKTGIAPAGFSMKGKSLYGEFDEEGNFHATRGWVKTDRDKDQEVQVLLDAMSGVLDEARILAPPPVAMPRETADNYTTIIPIGDAHLGALAWGAQCGDNFNLRIAEDNLKSAFDHIILLSPPTPTCTILNVGDYVHTDTNKNRTAHSGNILDVDTRWERILRVALRCLLYAVHKALEHHQSVRVVNNPGNHDEHTSLMLTLLLEAYFRNEPRVEVMTTPNAFKSWEFGACMFTTSHGDRIKPGDIPLLMATDFPEMWGRTTHRYHHGGHVHHIKVHEMNGMIVETHRTLAAKDEWHHRSGYRAGRSMDAIVYHREHGEDHRNRVDVRRLLTGALG